MVWVVRDRERRTLVFADQVFVCRNSVERCLTCGCFSASGSREDSRESAVMSNRGQSVKAILSRSYTQMQAWDAIPFI